MIWCLPLFHPYFLPLLATNSRYQPHYTIFCLYALAYHVPQFLSVLLHPLCSHNTLCSPLLFCLPVYVFKVFGHRNLNFMARVTFGTFYCTFINLCKNQHYSVWGEKGASLLPNWSSVLNSVFQLAVWYSLMVTQDDDFLN